jgi:threonylcarbamoyladenosine tRNA methylthiotransferase MtaB
MTQKRVAFHTLGCRLNLYETDGLSKTFSDLGIPTIDENEKPEILVINTCTVTNKADSKNRNVIRNAIKKNPGAQIWVTGCYAQTDKEVIEKIPGITGILGNNEKSKLPYIVLDKINSQTDQNLPFDRFSYSDVLPVDHTRAYLKIQDGCNRVCSYCKIPQARGKGISRDFQNILDQVNFLQDQSIPEIVLTGVNIGWFKDSNGKKGFLNLLEKILEKLTYSRLKISSIEPSDVNKDLAQLMKHPRFSKFLHIPLQSGSKKILKNMKRSYTPETFQKRIEAILNDNPDVFLGTDVIAGFPGETLEDFEETLTILKRYQFSKIHAFPYSPRAGTLASIFTDQIHGDVKKERILTLNNLSKIQFKNYCSKFFGKPLEGILERDNTILTDNSIRCILPENAYKKLTSGQFLEVIPLNFIENSKNEGLCESKLSHSD